MLADKDRIFTNLYGLHSPSLKAAQMRGCWDGTKFLFLACLITMFACVTSATVAAPTPQYKLDSKQKRVIEIVSLGGVGDCVPSALIGTVVARQFNNDGIDLISVTLENKFGERTFINLNTPNEFSLTDIEWIRRGLQTLLKVGNRVSLGVGFCGAGGRVNVLNAVKILHK
jgi:hypothetical protein